jgi:hypothetical protein
MSKQDMDFIIEAYAKLVGEASSRYRFLRFSEFSTEGKVALWRHDIDVSPHRALAMARIEAELGLSATYFVQVTSRFYSILEPEVADILRNIVALGHDIGLHFDAHVCATQLSPDYDRRIAFEAQILAEVAETQVNSFTLHNPTTLMGVSIDESHRAGLLNASCSQLRAAFHYCSDSNGIWRFRPLAEVLKDPAVDRLYALTHPEWWPLTPMLPRQRVQRCVEGRAENCLDKYDELLKKNGRPNIKEKI